MAPYPHAALLGQVATLALVYKLQPEAYGLVVRLGVRLFGFGSLLAVVFVSLFCVAVLSGDIAYLLVRIAVPEAEVWGESARTRWALAWAVTWLVQVPLWLGVLPSRSPLLVHELANLALTLHHLVLRHLGRPALAFPSATLVASTEGTQRSGIAALVAARTSLPLMYVASHGLPGEWQQVLCLFLLDVAPAVLAALAQRLGLLGSRGLVAQLPWELRYPLTHGGCTGPERNPEGSAVAAGAGGEEECDSEAHGTCSICLSSLCSRGGGAAAAGIAMAVRRQIAPGLSAARPRLQRRSLAPAAGLAAARVPADWCGGRIATTRCGHAFHCQCLSLAAETSNRCPECRTGLTRTSPGVELPDEDTLDAQMLCLAFGLVLGGSLLGMHWALWEVQRRILAPETQLAEKQASAALNRLMNLPAS